MPTTLEQFHQHLTGSDLKPVYLLAGEEHLLLLEAADALRLRARELEYLEREVLDEHLDPAGPGQRDDLDQFGDRAPEW